MRQADETVLRRWHERMKWGPDNRSSGRLSANLANANIIARGNQLLSYGPHFVLAEYLPDADLYVINGDRDSLTTGTHNRAVIGELRDERTIIVPYAALGSAGIDRATIRPLEVRPDDWSDVRHAVATLDEVPKGRRARGVQVERSAATLEDMPHHERRRYDYHAGAWIDAEPGPDGRYHWSEYTTVYDGADLINAETGLYEWSERVHRLGDSLFTAVAGGRRRAFISSFDYQERRPLYFLAELPRRHGATTVAEAIEALAPPAVRHAIAQGRDVKRQGDIFAIPVDLPDAIVYGRARRRARLTQWTRGARARPGEVCYRPPLTARQVSNMRRLERRLFHEKLAAFLVSAEDFRAAGRPKTGDGFRTRNRRLIARIASEAAEGTSTYRRDNYPPRPRWNDRDDYRRRYGRRAAEALSLARTEALIKYGLTIMPAMRDRLRATLMIHGTAHSATEIAVCAGGVTYARGTMRHAVELDERGRNAPDHSPVRLGDQWHLMVRNTVPRAR